MAVGGGTAKIEAKGPGPTTAFCDFTVTAAGGGAAAGLYWITSAEDADEVIVPFEGFDEVQGTTLLAKAFTAISGDQSNMSSRYLIVLSDAEEDNTANGFVIGSGTGTNTVNKTNVKITLRGAVNYIDDYGTNVTITKKVAGPLFSVVSGNTNDTPELILEDITLAGYNANTSALVVVGSASNKGKLTMQAGSRVTGNESNDTNGGGVYVMTSGAFVMKDGKIDNNKVNLSGNNYGGGVNATGSFEMRGGIIEWNVAGNSSASRAWGGGVYASRGFAMSGGTIQNNTALATANAWGGGVYTATFDMTDGNILNNTAVIGGGVVIPTNADNYFKMSGGVIAGNKAKTKGAAVMRYGNGTFEKTGGTIYGNGTDVGTNANKGTESNTVHSIEMGNTLAGYYDLTAEPGTVLKHSTVSGYSNVGEWSTN
jgi:hypothetical protein